MSVKGDESSVGGGASDAGSQGGHSDAASVGGDGAELLRESRFSLKVRLACQGLAGLMTL